MHIGAAIAALIIISLFLEMIVSGPKGQDNKQKKQ
jgi:hypothetical protein